MPMRFTISLPLHMPGARASNRESPFPLGAESTDCLPRLLLGVDHGVATSLRQSACQSRLRRGFCWPSYRRPSPYSRRWFSTRLNSWSGGSGAPASTLPREEQAPLWFGPQKPRDRGCRFATRLCSAWTARKDMPCREKRLQSAVPQGTGSMCYHEGTDPCDSREWILYATVLVLVCVEPPPHCIIKAVGADTSICAAAA
ncbi:hypothetical protein HDV63DRAFT_128850 [Trichoderma sp. SZMC 28014]